MLTFLSDGGTATPRGTEKHNPFTIRQPSPQPPRDAEQLFEGLVTCPLSTMKRHAVSWDLYVWCGPRTMCLIWTMIRILTNNDYPDTAQRRVRPGVNVVCFIKSISKKETSEMRSQELDCLLHNKGLEMTYGPGRHSDFCPKVLLHLLTIGTS